MRSARTLLAVSLVSSAVSSFGSPASAQTELEGGRRTHDGFYVRASGGYGYMTTTRGPGDERIRGWGPAAVVTVGGTPLAGFVVGGTVFAHLQPNPTVRFNGQPGPQWTTVLLAVGPSVDFYPNPKGGAHLGGGASFSTFNAVNYTSIGYGANAFVGYDTFISDEWSVGPLAQFAYSNSQRDVGGDAVRDNSFSFTGMLSFVYH